MATCVDGSHLRRDDKNRKNVQSQVETFLLYAFGGLLTEISKHSGRGWFLTSNKSMNEATSVLRDYWTAPVLLPTDINILVRYFAWWLIGMFSSLISSLWSCDVDTESAHSACFRPISDASSDPTIEVGSASFALHKFPLVSCTGRVQKLISEVKDSKVTWISLPTVPGGAEAFELAAKFCYGINIEISLSNIAMLRCAAHFLEMTEDRIIAANANNACKEQLYSGLLKLEQNYPTKQMEPEMPADWRGRSLTVMNLEFLQRVLSAVKLKGLKQDLISKILTNYAHTSLQRLVVRDPQLVKPSYMDLELHKKQKAIVEALISLLPTQSRKSSVPMAFPSSLLKSTIASSVSTSCRADLERRIGLQLDQATLEDILIPASSNGNSNHSLINDTDVILRIFSIFLNLDKDEDDDNNLLRDESEMVALDSNLTALRFIALAELLPDHARLLTDGHYRAVDIFLKVHPNIKDSERYRLCKTIDSQKLSQEACSHAAQNERLLVQMAVQVLYFEQIRLRNAMNGGHNQFFVGSLNGHFPQRSSMEQEAELYHPEITMHQSEERIEN
ncbi:hypothetical protein Ancab_019317 [Ancistrocladus abbreviatus]